MSDKIFSITDGTLNLKFDSVPFDSKKDFNEIKKKIRIASRKIIDEYNYSGADLEFSDDTEGEYIK